MFLSIVHIQEPAHLLLTDVGFEEAFPAHPFGAFFGDGFLREFVPKLDLVFGAMKRFFSVELGDIKLSFGFAGFFCCERSGGENKPEFGDSFQLLFQRLISVNGEVGSRNSHPAIFADRFF